ncbi:glycine cleavage system protein GcvH [Nocardioides convexus]|uniref:glycine cleavage system protein GcvH n=1 Tax=Nocardioides convexus TaxID=2712224 RepID=UPI0031015331
MALVGFGAVTQVRLNDTDETYAGQREQDLIDLLDGLSGTRQRTEAEIDRLEGVATGLRDDTTKRQAAIDQAQGDVDTLNILAGLVPVTGPGVRITITEENGRIEARLAARHHPGAAHRRRRGDRDQRHRPGGGADLLREHRRRLPRRRRAGRGALRHRRDRRAGRPARRDRLHPRPQAPDQERRRRRQGRGACARSTSRRSRNATSLATPCPTRGSSLLAMTNPADLKYTVEHEWLRTPGDAAGSVRVGITDYAQDALGDIVYVSLPEVGATVAAGDACGELESTKSVSDVYAPVSGEIVAVNEALDATPEPGQQRPVRRRLALRGRARHAR